MCFTHEARTVTVKACALCNGGLLEYDRFCRWCGARQPDQVAADEFNVRQLTDSASINAPAYATTALERAGANPGLYRRVSGPLVSAVIAGVAANSPQVCGLLTKKAILALISIPIWLIIILLSPLDAYAAAKNLLREN